MKQNKFRLPTNLQPLRYHLTVKPDLGNFTFSATESVDINVVKPTREAVLHSVDLNITKVVWKNGKAELHAKDWSYQKQGETVTITFAKPLTGKGKLYLEFNGSISDQLRGLYRSSYSHKGEQKYLATSQFEATDARRFMPCFDEPAHKAKFKVDVIIPKHLQVVSNSVEESVLPHEHGLKIVKFAETPKMSTYLLALIIGELEHVKGKSKRGVQIRIHTTPGKKAQAKFALEFTKKALDYLEGYFGIPYPLPVLDLLAIPDFSAGAMENWGAITFRETALLVDDNHSSFTQRQQVAEVIAHELVHQWFGNLVTMEWWTHLWLNESFATYMAYVTVDRIYPDWNFWTKFALHEQSYAMNIDCLRTTHPVEVPVHHPDEISEQFHPAIVYAKGASVLRMLANYIGPDNFRKGLGFYLKKHSYKNTSSIDLWSAFETVSGKPVQKVMKAWTIESGYPVLNVRTNGNHLELTQEEFKLLPVKGKSRVWPIPYRIQTDADTVTDPALLEKSQAKLELNEDFRFVNMDYDDGSLTVVNYDMSLLARLLPQFQNKTLNTLDRLALMRDSFLLVKSGLLPTDVYLEMLLYTDNEDSYVIWSEISKNLAQIERLLGMTEVEKWFETYRKELFGQLLLRKEVGLSPKKGEPKNLSLVRSVAFANAGLAGYAPAVKEAARLFALARKGKHVDPDLRSAVYAMVARHGTETDFNNLLRLHEETEFHAHKLQILNGIISGSTAKHAEKVMDLIESELVRDQDRTFAFANAFLNSHLKAQTWARLQKNWSKWYDRFAGSKMLSVLLSGAMSFATDKELQSFKNFLKGKSLPGAKQSVAQTTEKIEINVAWQKRDLGLIKAYLRKN